MGFGALNITADLNNKKQFVRRKKKGVVPLLDAYRFERLTPESAIEKFKGAVLKWANHYVHVAPGLDIDDLVSVGNIGVLKAVKNYAPEKMNYSLSSFNSYVESSIKWEIKNEISSFVKSREEVVRTKVGRKYIDKVVRHMPGFVSFDAPVGKDEEGLVFHEIIKDTRRSNTCKSILIDEMWKHIERLPGKLGQVLALRYKGSGKTLKEVGESFGLTKERVRQIEIKAIKKLRAFMPA